ncbi:MAG: NDP-sugar synthase [Planctomycetaceae bacterium]|nr:NDP-sugar synthase [Planctomycetaceae bacterium]
MTNPSQQPALRAIVFATSELDRSAIELDRPVFLMPLIDKPLVHHVIEHAVRCGARQVDVVVGSHDNAIREIANDGKRWGVQVRVHLPVGQTHSYSLIRGILGRNPHQDATVLMLHTDVLCPNARPELPAGADGPVVYTHAGTWSGIALLNQQDAIKNYPLNGSRLQFESALTEQAASRGLLIEDQPTLTFGSGTEFLTSQNRMLSGEFPDLLSHLKTAEPGVWIGRNTRLHPTARVTAPVYLGANCDIGKGVTLGPSAVVEDACLIDEGVNVAHCLVLSSSRVGEGLDLKNTLMCGTKVFNTKINAAIDICDDVLASDLASVSFLKLFSGLASRLAGMLLFVLTIPVLSLLALIAFLRPQVRWVKKDFVRTPVPENQYLWKTCQLLECQLGDQRRTGRYALWCDLVTRVIPGLSAVAWGRLRLVGVSPRCADELEELPKPWRDMLLAAQTGLISESLIQFGPDAPTDPRSVADLWHSSSPRRLIRALLLGRYLGALVLGPQQKICGAPLRSRNSFFDGTSKETDTGSTAMKGGV